MTTFNMPFNHPSLGKRGKTYLRGGRISAKIRNFRINHKCTLGWLYVTWIQMSIQELNILSFKILRKDSNLQYDVLSLWFCSQSYGNSLTRKCDPGLVWYRNTWYPQRIVLWMMMGLRNYYVHHTTTILPCISVQVPGLFRLYSTHYVKVFFIYRLLYSIFVSPCYEGYNFASWEVFESFCGSKLIGSLL